MGFKQENIDFERYIKITDIKDKQMLLLEMLGDFHDICEKNGLIYNVFGGTLLGAVRHKGFIPWDDDVDVTMPREDYNKFVEIIRSGCTEKYCVHAFPDDNYIYPYAKFGFLDSFLFENEVSSPYNGLTFNMDIFPVDGYPVNEEDIDEYDVCEQYIIAGTYKFNLYKSVKDPIYIFRRIIAKHNGYKYYVAKQINIFSKYKIL